MNVTLAYGVNGLAVELPDERTTVITPHYPQAAPDARRLLREVLRAPTAGRPLRERVRPGQTVAIAACDGTRPQPREQMITAVLDEIEGIISPDDVVVVVASGTHRGNTATELRAMFGDVMDRVRVVNHNGRDAQSLRWLGRFGDDVPVWLNRDWVDADVRITTGFVEPHLFAGFSGGPKLVAPGLAALDTVLTLHNAARIGHPRAVWGITHGNPIHDDIRAIAVATGVDFALDVVLDDRKRVVTAFGGDLLEMHAGATATAGRIAMRPVPHRFDVVITTNSGFPLDQNLYQAVKGMSAAHQVVRAGGTIICAVECRDGFPDHGGYRAVLASQDSPQAILDEIEARETTVPDQWSVQVQARIQATSRVVMHTSYLSDADLAEAHLEQIHDIDEFVRRLDPDQSICVLPDGPQTIPYTAG